MSEKIFRASFLTTFIALVAAIALIIGELSDTFEKQIFLEAESEAKYISHALENEGLDFLDGLDYADKRITLISPDGIVLYDNKTDAAALDNHARREEIKQATENGVGTSIRYSNTLTEKTLYYAVKLSDGKILRVSSEQSTIIAILIGLMQPVLFIFIIILIATALVSAKVASIIVKPINSLDPDNPEKSEIYEELTPLLKKLSEQKRTISRQLKKLSERDEMRREFTANVSHELKTPLTSISGFAELMMNGDVPQDTVKDFSKTIYDEAHRLISLVNDIITLSELDGQAISYEKETVDLYELSEEIIHRLKSKAENKSISLNLIGSNVSILAVRKILDEMIYNLCDNAIKYNKEKGKVDIVISGTENRISLTVRDNGIGIPQKYKDRVFERFFRADKSHSKEIDGTGLGLAIVKHGAKYHNAEINLETAEGLGTSITLTFHTPQ